MSTRLRVTCAVAAIAIPLTAAAAPAEAKSPPRGKYGCTISGSQFAGNLFILANNRYRVNRSKRGRYRNLPGNKMRFPTGVYKGLYRGFWHRTDDGRVEIELTSIESGFTSTYCILEKRA
jgi:hypothetical protein